MLPRKRIFSDEGGEGDQVFGIFFRVASAFLQQMADANRRKLTGADRAAGRRNLRLWLFIIEVGLGVAILLVMLALWWTLETSEEDESAQGKIERVSRQMELEVDEIVCDRHLYPPPWELRTDQVTILVNGFAEARIPLLQASVKTYSSSSVVNAVFVLWGNTSTPDSLLLAAKFESIGAPIYVVRQETKSLNDRFLPRDYIRTKAVMICDDDITIDASSLQFALQVWRENQQRIVGFFPRAHSYQLDIHSWIYTKHQHKYSIMLTKIMILATDYLYRYTCQMPTGVREYVDKGMNCEDIAMNFLVSNFSGLGPLLVEGQPRDWGDTRNSEEEMTNMGLSARTDHRKDRGDCIIEFQRLWNGMELHFSYSKAISNVDEQVNCEKFGHLIDCDKQAISERDVRRLVGHNLVKRTHRFAYVTLLQAKHMYYSALVLAQSLRNTGTVHDLILLLDANCGFTKANETLSEHFDVVKEVGKSSHRWSSRIFGKLNAWNLKEYDRVVYIDSNILVLSNLDHLFDLPEPAAVPQVNFPEQFNTGLLVLQPSNATYMDLLNWVENTFDSVEITEDELLNDFFSGWFQMPTEHRLPMYLNMPLHLVGSAPFLGLNESSIQEVTGQQQPAALRFQKRDLTFVLKQGVQNSDNSDDIFSFLTQRKSSAIANGWFAIWLELLNAIKSNRDQPLDDDKASHLSWRPSKVKTLLWPPRRQMAAIHMYPNLNAPRRQAFATVIWSIEQLVTVAGWATTYSQWHPSSQYETLLLVHPSVEWDSWQPYRSLFHTVVAVEEFDPKMSIDNMSAMVMHLWNQTNYNKLVYVDPSSIFIDSCNFLMDFEPFAATPNPTLPDTFLLQLMVIQPDANRFSELVSKLSLRGDTTAVPLLRFMNQQLSYWYQSTPKHRIGTVFNSWLDLHRGLKVDERPWKILTFYAHNVPHDRSSETAKMWVKIVCNMRDAERTSTLLDPLCGAP